MANTRQQHISAEISDIPTGVKISLQPHHGPSQELEILYSWSSTKTLCIDLRSQGHAQPSEQSGHTVASGIGTSQATPAQTAPQSLGRRRSAVEHSSEDRQPPAMMTTRTLLETAKASQRLGDGDVGDDPDYSPEPSPHRIASSMSPRAQDRHSDVGAAGLRGTQDQDRPRRITKRTRLGGNLWFRRKSLKDYIERSLGVLARTKRSSSPSYKGRTDDPELRALVDIVRHLERISRARQAGVISISVSQVQSWQSEFRNDSLEDLDRSMRKVLHS